MGAFGTLGTPKVCTRSIKGLSAVRIWDSGFKVQGLGFRVLYGGFF